MYTYEVVTNRSGGSPYLVVQVDAGDGSKVAIAKCGTSGDANLIAAALNA